MSEQTHKITLTLTDREFYALARIGLKQCRGLRWQAVYMLRDALLNSGELVPDPSSELAAKVTA